MNKTRENVVMVSMIIKESDEWSNVKSDLVDLMWNYVYMPEDTIGESVWNWKWMLGVTPKHLNMELIKEDGYMFDWDYIIQCHKLPTDDQWKQMLYHYDNI